MDSSTLSHTDDMIKEQKGASIMRLITKHTLVLGYFLFHLR